MRPLLSVVVVNWNSRDDLGACLRSLREQREALEVIAVDNGSSDGSAAMVEADFPGVMLVAESENLGFGGGCNRGIAQATGEWVCLLNNDATAEPGWAEAMLRAARGAPPDCGMLQSLILYRNRPGIVNSTGIVVRWDGWGRDRDEGRRREECTEPAEIFCPTGGAAAYRRSMLDATRLQRGWLDAEHFLYYEDLDLGWRARLAGWSARYVPDAVVQHVWHGSTRRHPEDWLERLTALNRIRTLVKNASAELLARLGPKDLYRHLRRAPEWRPVAAALASSWNARTEVEAMRRIARSAVEARWFSPKGGM